MLNEEGFAIPVHEGVHGKGDYDDAVVIRWWVYTRAQWDAGVVCVPGEYWGGPGRYFRNAPHVRVSRNRVLITQRCGLDI